MNKPELTPAKLACLKDAAESINPIYRNWFLNDYKRWVETHDNGDAIIVCHPEQIQPALGFIAEADPATVLAMVEEIEQLRRMERKWGQMLRNVKDTAPDLETFLSPDAFKINESEAGQ